MKRSHGFATLLFLCLFTTAALSQSGLSVTDSVGRTVQLPPKVERIYAAGPPAAVLVFTLAPEKLIGWPMKLAQGAEEFLPPKFRSLPKVGRLTGRGGTANFEEVLKTKPDVVVDTGSLTGTSHSLSNKLAEKTGLPTLLFDGSMKGLPHTYRELGKAFGTAKRGEELAAYAEKILAEIHTGSQKIPHDARLKVYIARGPAGLETATAGSINSEALELVGEINAGAKAGPAGTMAKVSPEDLLLWKPDVVITMEKAAYDHIQSDPLWAKVSAVTNKKVYLAPTTPFGWVDYPPAVNRLLGIQWLAKLLHPAQFVFDLRARTKEFYTLFYQVDLTNAQLDSLLAAVHQ
jgi:iron complex transport system substrate-binding protein